MSALSRWLAKLAQQWFDAFRHRYGLQNKSRALNESFRKRLLHVGCGPADISNIPVPGFQSGPWEEIRFDINNEVHPDIVGTMTDMGAVPDAHVDAIYSSHNIEHLSAHEVPVAFKEFLRVLNAQGFLTLTCPDLQSVCALVAQGKLMETAYMSAAGPIAPIDILYGHRNALAAGNHYMAHRFGFTLETLVAQLRDSGFVSVIGHQRAESLDLWVLASKSERSEEELKLMAQRYLPSLAADSA
jgi:hypothetical protein